MEIVVWQNGTEAQEGSGSPRQNQKALPCCWSAGTLQCKRNHGSKRDKSEQATTLHPTLLSPSIVRIPPAVKMPLPPKSRPVRRVCVRILGSWPSRMFRRLGQDPCRTFEQRGRTHVPKLSRGECGLAYRIRIETKAMSMVAVREASNHVE